MRSIAVRYGAGFKTVQFSTLIGWRRTARASTMLMQMLGSRTVNAYLHRAPEELYDLSKDPWLILADYKANATFK